MKKQLLTKMLLVVALLGAGSVSSWGATETYDFNNFISGLSGDIGVTNTSIVYKAINKQDLTWLPDFNQENFSTKWRSNAAPYAFQNVRFASQGSFYLERGSGGYYLRNRQTGARYFTIANLYRGDVVTFTIQGTVTFVSTNAKIQETDVAVAAGDAVTSTSYVITEDGDLDLSVDKSGNYSGFKKIIITTADDLTGPTITAVAANGVNRTVELTGGSTNEDGASITSYRYTTDGSIPSATKGTLYDADEKIIINSTTTIKAVAISSTGKASTFTSSTIEAGTVLPLNAPVVSLVTNSDFTRNGAFYYPQYAFSSDQSSVIGNPSVTYTYTIAGEDNAVANPTGYSEAKAGELIVTANADGYESTSASVIEIKAYVRSKSYDFSAPYTLNANWSLDKKDGGLTGFTSEWGYKDRYKPSAENINESGTLFTDLAFSYNDKSLYFFIQELGVAYGGGSGHNTTTITVAGLTSEDYTVYKKASTDGSVSCVVVTGTNTWAMGKYSGTGAHCLHGIFVYSPAPSSVSGTITDCGWSTFASEYPLDLSTISDGTVYYASTASGSTVTLSTTDATTVPAGEGIMVKGTPNTSFTISVAASGTAISGNLLKGQKTAGNVAASDTENNKYHYVFGFSKTDASVYGFYNLTADTEVAAGKAYLETTEALSSGASRLNIVFDDDVTGINMVNGSGLKVNDYYNLSGQRVSQPTKGLYIVNGKKVIIK